VVSSPARRCRYAFRSGVTLIVSDRKRDVDESGTGILPKARRRTTGHRRRTITIVVVVVVVGGGGVGVVGRMPSARTRKGRAEHAAVAARRAGYRMTGSGAREKQQVL
jgi:hypothetical protein